MKHSSKRRDSRPLELVERSDEKRSDGEAKAALMAYNRHPIMAEVCPNFRHFHTQGDIYRAVYCGRKEK